LHGEYYELGALVMNFKGILEDLDLDSCSCRGVTRKFLKVWKNLRGVFLKKK
jgi:hypothetical protein